ncbi:phasin family protein [Microvirga rosea]|uniref:phasin family protein n=1 Tax=Microvirga rosea TaxID=2715425 RepID=UPI001D0AFF73|nr:phasin family protein [Microvirga rosea]MCB8819412.1 phasin family protein [Microvirga rosea]
MSATRRFSMTPPDKANELFDKLSATSDNAVRTRERLLANLKDELTLLAALQEEHLFPVLRRHGMQDLVQEATNDNEATGALMAELERMPKDSSEFLGRVSELRRIFQQHIRDDRKELLPAVLKVLSEEEAEAVAEKVEDKMAAMEQTKRAEAQRTRERVEAAQRVTEDTAVTLWAGMEGFQTTARTMQEALERSFNVFSELTRRSAGQATPGLSLIDGDALGLTEEASQNLRAAAQAGTTLAHRFQDISREAFELSQRRLQRNLDGLDALARCRSLQDLVAVQSGLVRDNLEQTVENSRRMAELTIQMADEATRTMTVQPDKTVQGVSRVA